VSGKFPLKQADNFGFLTKMHDFASKSLQNRAFCIRNMEFGDLIIFVRKENKSAVGSRRSAVSGQRPTASG